MHIFYADNKKIDVKSLNVGDIFTHGRNNKEAVAWICVSQKIFCVSQKIFGLNYRLEAIPIYNRHDPSTRRQHAVPVSAIADIYVFRLPEDLHSEILLTEEVPKGVVLTLRERG